MKKLIKKIFDIVTFIKVATICTAAIYFGFWFYRFFNLGYVDYIYPFFDFLISPLKAIVETVQYDGDRVNETGYIIFGIIMLVVSFLFAQIEKLVVELDRRYDLSVLAKKQKRQKIVNEILEKNYSEKIEKYDCLNILISYTPEFLNELVAQNINMTLEKGLSEAYNKTILYLKNNFKNALINNTNEGIFISITGFMEFDNIIDIILNGIKQVKSEAEKKYINLKFLFTLDVQEPNVGLSTSFRKLVKIASVKYYGKAVGTSIFNMRFELMKDKSKYTTEVLGFSAKENSNEDNTDLYLLKTKTRFI